MEKGLLVGFFLIFILVLFPASVAYTQSFDESAPWQEGWWSKATSFVSNVISKAKSVASSVASAIKSFFSGGGSSNNSGGSTGSTSQTGDSKTNDNSDRDNNDSGGKNTDTSPENGDSGGGRDNDKNSEKNYNGGSGGGGSSAESNQPSIFRRFLNFFNLGERPNEPELGERVNFDGSEGPFDKDVGMDERTEKEGIDPVVGMMFGGLGAFGGWALGRYNANKPAEGKPGLNPFGQAADWAKNKVEEFIGFQARAGEQLWNNHIAPWVREHADTIKFVSDALGWTSAGLFAAAGVAALTGYGAPAAPFLAVAGFAVGAVSGGLDLMVASARIEAGEADLDDYTRLAFVPLAFVPGGGGGKQISKEVVKRLAKEYGDDVVKQALKVLLAKHGDDVVKVTKEEFEILVKRVARLKEVREQFVKEFGENGVIRESNLVNFNAKYKYKNKFTPDEMHIKNGKVEAVIQETESKGTIITKSNKIFDDAVKALKAPEAYGLETAEDFKVIIKVKGDLPPNMENILKTDIELLAQGKKAKVLPKGYGMKKVKDFDLVWKALNDGRIQIVSV